MQVTADADDSHWHLRVLNTGVPLDAATLAAFEDPSSHSHAAHDPLARMRTGLRFAARVLHLSGGSLVATCTGTGRARDVVVTSVRLLH